MNVDLGDAGEALDIRDQVNSCRFPQRQSRFLIDVRKCARPAPPSSRPTRS